MPYCHTHSHQILRQFHGAAQKKPTSQPSERVNAVHEPAKIITKSLSVEEDHSKTAVTTASVKKPDYNITHIQYKPNSFRESVPRDTKRLSIEDNCKRAVTIPPASIQDTKPGHIKSAHIQYKPNSFLSSVPGLSHVFNDDVDRYENVEPELVLAVRRFILYITDLTDDDIQENTGTTLLDRILNRDLRYRLHTTRVNATAFGRMQTERLNWVFKPHALNLPKLHFFMDHHDIEQWERLSRAAFHSRTDVDRAASGGLFVSLGWYYNRGGHETALHVVRIVVNQNLQYETDTTQQREQFFDPSGATYADIQPPRYMPSYICETCDESMGRITTLKIIPCLS